MAYSLNRASLIGNLGSDPDLRTTPQGSQVCSFSVATTERYKDKNGEMQDTTDWHRVVLWDKLAEIASQYLKKGSKIYIEGKIKTRSYEKDGITRSITEIVGNNLVMLSSSSKEGGAEYNQERSYSSSYSQNNHSTALPPDDVDDVPF